MLPPFKFMVKIGWALYASDIPSPVGRPFRSDHPNRWRAGNTQVLCLRTVLRQNSMVYFRCTPGSCIRATGNLVLR